MLYYIYLYIHSTYFVHAPDLIHGQIYMYPYLIIICCFSYDRCWDPAEVYHHGVCVSGRASPTINSYHTFENRRIFEPQILAKDGMGVWCRHRVVYTACRVGSCHKAGSWVSALRWWIWFWLPLTCKCEGYAVRNIKKKWMLHILWSRDDRAVGNVIWDYNTFCRA